MVSSLTLVTCFLDLLFLVDYLSSGTTTLIALPWLLRAICSWMAVASGILSLSFQGPVGVWCLLTMILPPYAL
jgi:hypothetical protein